MGVQHSTWSWSRPMRTRGRHCSSWGGRAAPSRAPCRRRRWRSSGGGR